MTSQSMYARANMLEKEFVYDQYLRLTFYPRDYEKITRKKMLEEIYEQYSDPNEILSFCTTRELKYLKLLLNKKTKQETLLSFKYKWERDTLVKKFLIMFSDGLVYIPDEIVSYVTEAIKSVDWKATQLLDDLSILIISFVKIQGTSLLDPIVSFATEITGLDREFIENYVLSNRLVSYYLLITERDFDHLGTQLYAIHYDYLDIEELIEEERKNQGIAGSFQVDLEMYESIFYYDFDINNPKVREFVTLLDTFPFFGDIARKRVRHLAALNADRTEFRQRFEMLRYFDDEIVKAFLTVFDEAMDEMPSAALNGFTPNQARELSKETKELEANRDTHYKKQQNAHISRQDNKLFYKIYFGLLDFTNKKYKINPSLKIYKASQINPYEILDIVEAFWENKELIVLEFCLANPYKFNKQELSVTSEFKKGFRDRFILAKFESEYTALINEDKTYMIKGLNSNIDEVVDYKKLPTFVETAIIPFKGVLVYDGILSSSHINMGIDFTKAVEEEYSEGLKYYHL